MLYDALSLSQKRRIDRVCKDFEDSRFDDSPPPLSSFLEQLEPEDREIGLLELIALDYELRVQNQESPTVETYHRELPNDAELVAAAYQRAVEEAPASATPSEPQSPRWGDFPRVLGDFRIVREIGRGGMGRVYEAVQESLHRRVALKILPPTGWLRDRGLERFQREARAIARLHHSHIVDVFGSGTESDVAYIAMQLIDGPGLDQIIEQSRESVDVLVAQAARLSLSSNNEQPLTEEEAGEPPALRNAPASRSIGVDATSEAVIDRTECASTDAVDHGPRRTIDNPSHGNRLDADWFDVKSRAMLAARIGSQIGAALQYAHSAGVLHRDVKPSNILIDQQGAAWLTDFGLAKLLVGDPVGTLTEQGDLVGTLRYMAPETLQDKTDARSDVFSLGLTLLELITLKPAFETVDRDELLAKRLRGEPPQFGLTDSGVPRDLATVIRKSIELDPAARYQTAGELAADLDRFLNDEPITARRSSLLEQFTRWAKRNRLLATLLISMTALVTVVAISSTIAAGYFRNLNQTLATTVGELTEATTKLTTARDDARKSASENLRLADEAMAARRASQVIVADLQTERGLLAAEQGDSAASMLWFANAATQTPHDPQRQAANRLRARNTMSELPLPLASMRFPVSGVRRRLAFQPQGDFGERAARPHVDATADARTGERNSGEPPELRRDLLLSVARGQIQIWDWRAEHALPWTTDSANNFADACWMPNGRQVAIALLSGDVQIREASSGEIVTQFSANMPLACIACSFDGRRLAIGGDAVQVWNVSAEPVHEHAWPHPQKVYSLIFNRSGNRLATACRDKLARVFAIGDSAQQSAPLFDPVAHRLFFDHPPAFLTDRILVTAASRQIEWRDATTGSSLKEFPSTRLGGFVTRLATSDDDQWLAAGTSTNCELWSSSGERTALAHPHHVSDAAFSHAGELLTACFDWHTYLRTSPTSPEAVLKIPQMQTADCCAFSADAALIAVCDDKTVRLWKRPGANLIKLAAPGWAPAQWRPRLSFDGKWVTRGRWHAMPLVPDLNELSILDTSTGQAVGPVIRLSDIVDSSLCADQRSVAVISRPDNSGLLSIYEVASGKQSLPPIELASQPCSVAARPGSPQVAVLCQNGTLLVFDARDGKCIREVTHPNWWWGNEHYTRSARVDWSPDGTALVSVTARGEVFVRDADTGSERFAPIRLNPKRGVCSAIDFSADSRLLVTAITGENAVQVWNLQTGTACCPPIPHPGDSWGLFAVKFSPDGRLVFTANKDRFARLWDWQQGTLVCPPLQHPNEVYDVGFTSDGQHGLTIDRADTVRIWDLAIGKRIAAPIHYPTRDDGFPMALFNVAVVGDRAILGAPDFPILDLAPLLSEPQRSVDSLLTLSELISAQRLALGESNNLTSAEWQQRWEQLRDRPSDVDDEAAATLR